MARPRHELHAQMEIANNIGRMTPEERRAYLRRESFKELREMEMERRRRVALEELQRSRREKEDRDEEAESVRRQKERGEEERRRREAKQREEEKRKEDNQKALEKEKQQQLKTETLQWREVMMVQEQPIMRPIYTISDLKKAQQRRHEEAELRCVQHNTSLKRLTSVVKSQEQGQRKTLINNWVGEQTTRCEEELRPDDSALSCSAEGKSLKSQTSPKSTRALHWLQKRLKSGLRKKQDEGEDELERKKETRRLRELYGQRKCSSLLSEQIDGYCMSRNRILKKSMP